MNSRNSYSRLAIGSLTLAAILWVQAPEPAYALQSNCSYTDLAGSGRIYYDPFVIFFDLDSSAITPPSARVLDQAASAYADLPHCAIAIHAHTDRVGTSAYNRALSERRAKSIAAYFRSRGVGWELILQSHGETRPLVETPDGTKEPQNRRAEIVIVPPTGRPGSPG